MPPRVPAEPENFWKRVDVRGPDECWPWLKGKDPAGYGNLQWGPKIRKAHIVAYELSVGPVPDGFVLDHRCHTDDKECPGGPSCLHRRCQNPAHLEPVERAENFRRGRQGRQFTSRTHCPQGHEYTPENTGSQRDPRGGENRYRSCRECARLAAAGRRKRLWAAGLTSRGKPRKRNRKEAQ